MKKLIEELKQYEPRGMHEHQLPVAWASARNDVVYDVEGKKYIDFTCGIFVTNVGHSTVSGAIQHQAQHLLHCYTFPHLAKLDLHKKLREMTGFEKAFFLSAGTEATDSAVKIMKLYRKAPCIISIAGAMHGKGMCAEKMKGPSDNNWWATEHDPGFYHLDDPFNGIFAKDMSILTFKRKPEEIAGFMIESYRGWNAKFYKKKYIQDLFTFANKHDIPVCFDEIQGGFGRTGKLFAYEHYGVRPDLVCVGKGLGGGLPISAVLGPAKMLDVPDDLSSTHSANPLCCAAALSAMEYFDKAKLSDLAEAKGQLMKREFKKLLKYKNVKEINSKGMLSAIIFENTKEADKVIYGAMKMGLLMVRTGRESIKIGPPLTIQISSLMEGLKILEESIKDAKKK